MGPREDDGKGEIGPGFFVRGIPPSVHKQRQTFSPLPSTDFVQNMAPTFCFKSRDAFGIVLPRQLEPSR